MGISIKCWEQTENFSAWSLNVTLVTSNKTSVLFAHHFCENRPSGVLGIWLRATWRRVPCWDTSVARILSDVSISRKLSYDREASDSARAVRWAGISPNWFPWLSLIKLRLFSRVRFTLSVVKYCSIEP